MKNTTAGPHWLSQQRHHLIGTGGDFSSYEAWFPISWLRNMCYDLWYQYMNHGDGEGLDLGPFTTADHLSDRSITVSFNNLQYG